MFLKRIFKTFCAVLFVTNIWNIVMEIFNVAQGVVSQNSPALSLGIPPP